MYSVMYSYIRQQPATYQEKCRVLANICLQLCCACAVAMHQLSVLQLKMKYLQLCQFMQLLQQTYMKPQYSERIVRKDCMGQSLCHAYIHRQLATYINYNSVQNVFNHSVYDHAARVSRQLVSWLPQIAQILYFYKGTKLARGDQFQLPKLVRLDQFWLWTDYFAIGQRGMDIAFTEWPCGKGPCCLLCAVDRRQWAIRNGVDEYLESL